MMFFAPHPLPHAPASVTVPVTGSGLDAAGNPVSVSGVLSVTTSTTPPQTGLWVAPGGSDLTGDGSPGRPFATPARALQGVTAGGTVTLHGGTYPGMTTVNAAAVTLQSAPGETAVLAVSNTDPSQVNAINLEATGITLSHLEISGGYYHGVKVDAAGAQIVDCKIHDQGDSGIKIVPGCHDVQVLRTEIYHCGRREPANAPMIDCVRGDRLHVADCYLHDTPNYGVCIKGGAIGALVERCRIENGWCGVVLGQSTDLTWFDRATNPELWENVDGTVRNCLIRHMLYAGLGCWAALRPKLLNNTVLDAAQQGQGGIFLMASGHWPFGVEVDQPCQDVLIENNIVSVPATSQANFYISGHALRGTLTCRHNLYWRGGVATQFIDINGYPPAPLWEANLAAFALRWSTETGSLEKDPLLDSQGAPLTGSPVLGAGQAEPAVVDDLHGTGRRTPGDIGAIQGTSLPARTPKAPALPKARTPRQRRHKP